MCLLYSLKIFCLETQLYNYGELGTFLGEGAMENLRVMGIRLPYCVINMSIWEKKYCTEYEGKLAMLRDFPPLNYLFLSGSTGEVYCSSGQSMGE